MPIHQRKKLVLVSMAFLGAALGACLGSILGHAVLLRTAKTGLSVYARELSGHAEEFSSELNSISTALKHSPFSYCSAQEIASLQAMTYRSRDLKDIGRTRNGLLYCSAFLGHLTRPFVEGEPDLTLPNGTHVYINVPLVVASADEGRGTVLESGQVDAVLSPNAFDHWGRPHMLYMVVAANSLTGKMVRIAGAPLDVKASSVLSGAQGVSYGTLFSSHCSHDTAACVVSAEAIADVWNGSRSLLLGYTGLGALAGFGLGLGFGLVYLQNNGSAAQLHRCIRQNSNRLWLVYQPIVDLPTRQISGVEALLRWKDRDGNLISPDVFISLAEDRGYIRELTALVLQRATCELFSILKNNPGFSLSINISASDLQGDTLLPLLDRHVARAGISPRQIALELTERSTADLKVVGNAIRALRDQGYKVHIDDFGTGFSSLSYLNQLDVDAIKIDRSFTRSIGTGAATASVLPQILAMVEALDLNVIVEGVESEFQVDFLQLPKGNLSAQGWYFGRPKPLEELKAFLMEKPNSVTHQSEPDLREHEICPVLAS